MSRYNQFAGGSGKLNVKGNSTPEGQAVLNVAMPLINSWVAQCRLAQKQSGLSYFRKYLNTAILKADWTWNNGGEVLDVEVFSNAEVTELAKPLIPKPEFVEPREESSSADPIENIPPEVLVELEEIQIENGLPPLPPQLVTCFVVLYNNTDCVVYDMRSLKKGLENQTPLLKNFTTQSDWSIPVTEVTVRRLRDYFGQGINGGSNFNYWDYLSHYCLQMKNSEIMGGCAVATVQFSGGIFTCSGGYGVYRMKAGLKSCQTLQGPFWIGQVGLNPGFPALNATDNMVFANTATYTLTAEGQLSQSGSDVYGHDGDLASMYSVPSTPLIPRFIDENGEAYFDLAYNWAYVLPSMGERWLTGLFDATPNDFKRSLTVSEAGSGSTTISYPVLTQENGIDVLRAKIVDASFELRTTELGGNTYYNVGVGIPETRGVPPGLFCVPYPPSQNDYTCGYNDVGTQTLTSTFLSADKSSWGGRPPPQSAGPEYEHMFLGTMQVSNGEYNLQGYAIHGDSYDDTKKIWPLDTWYFYMNGSDYTSTMTSITGASAEDIQIVFMDVPWYSAQTIKKFTPP